MIPGPSGSSRRLTEYLKALPDRFTVVVLSAKTPDHSHIEKYQGARLLRVPVGSGDLASRIQAFERAVRRQLESEDYALAHFTDPFGGYALCELKGDYGYRLIYEAQTFPSQELRFTHPQLEGDRRFLSKVRRQELFCLMNADLVITGSQTTRSFIQGLGAAEEQVRVLRAPVDLTPYAPSVVGLPDGKPLRMMYLGSQVGWQGLPLLLRATALAAKQEPVRLTLVGAQHPDWKPHLEDLVREQGLQDLVEFQPPVAHDDLAKVLALADVGVLPLDDSERNRMQGGPLAKVSEYLAAGRPVIAAELPVTRELIPSSAAVFFAPGDVRAMADRIIELARDVPRRLALGRAARAHAETALEAGRIRGRLLDLYDGLLEKRGPRPTGDSSESLPDVTMTGTPTNRLALLGVSEPSVESSAPSPAAPRNQTLDAAQEAREAAPIVVGQVVEERLDRRLVKTEPDARPAEPPVVMGLPLREEPSDEAATTVSPIPTAPDKTPRDASLLVEEPTAPKSAPARTASAVDVAVSARTTSKVELPAVPGSSEPKASTLGPTTAAAPDNNGAVATNHRGEVDTGTVAGTAPGNASAEAPATSLRPLPERLGSTSEDNASGSTARAQASDAGTNPKTRDAAANLLKSHSGESAQHEDASASSQDAAGERAQLQDDASLPPRTHGRDDQEHSDEAGSPPSTVQRSSNSEDARNEQAAASLANDGQHADSTNTLHREDAAQASERIARQSEEPGLAERDDEASSRSASQRGANTTAAAPSDDEPHTRAATQRSALNDTASLRDDEASSQSSVQQSANTTAAAPSDDEGRSRAAPQRSALNDAESLSHSEAPARAATQRSGPNDSGSGHEDEVPANAAQQRSGPNDSGSGHEDEVPANAAQLRSALSTTTSAHEDEAPSPTPIVRRPHGLEDRPSEREGLSPRSGNHRSRSSSSASRDEESPSPTPIVRRPLGLDEPQREPGASSLSNGHRRRRTDHSQREEDSPSPTPIVRRPLGLEDPPEDRDTSQATSSRRRANSSDDAAREGDAPSPTPIVRRPLGLEDSQRDEDGAVRGLTTAGRPEREDDAPRRTASPSRVERDDDALTVRRPTPPEIAARNAEDTGARKSPSIERDEEPPAPTPIVRKPGSAEREADSPTPIVRRPASLERGDEPPSRRASPSDRDEPPPPSPARGPTTPERPSAAWVDDHEPPAPTPIVPMRSLVPSRGTTKTEPPRTASTGAFPALPPRSPDPARVTDTERPTPPRLNTVSDTDRPPIRGGLPVAEPPRTASTRIPVLFESGKAPIRGGSLSDTDRPPPLPPRATAPPPVPPRQPPPRLSPVDLSSRPATPPVLKASLRTYTPADDEPEEISSSDAQPLEDEELDEVSPLSARGRGDEPEEISADEVLEADATHEDAELDDEGPSPEPPPSALNAWFAQLAHGYCPPEGTRFARHTPPTTFPGRDDGPQTPRGASDPGPEGPVRGRNS
nr:glycosyltransferase [Citreicoccus inhibens]